MLNNNCHCCYDENIWPTGGIFICVLEKEGGMNLFGRESSVIAPSLVCINLELPSTEILVKILFNFKLLIIHSTPPQHSNTKLNMLGQSIRSK